MKARLKSTRDMANPHYYITALHNEYGEHAYDFDEDILSSFKGHWRDKVFRRPEAPLDVEIGTGNGFHFAYYSEVHPERNVVGLEVKYKPLIQSIRRALNAGCSNARMVRYNASQLEDLFAEGEVDNLIIHHPDPWPKKRHWKHRLIQPEFMRKIHRLQKPDTWVEFKTDSLDYFEWSREIFETSDYAIEEISYDWHSAAQSHDSYRSHFEKLFARQGIAINYALLRRR